MLGVVVVGLELGARVGQMLDLGLEAVMRARRLDAFGELAHRELLRELVEHTELAALRRVQHCELHASDRVADVQEAARLASLAVNRQRVIDGGLRAEADRKSTRLNS